MWKSDSWYKIMSFTILSHILTIDLTFPVTFTPSAKKIIWDLEKVRATLKCECVHKALTEHFTMLASFEYLVIF